MKERPHEDVVAKYVDLIAQRWRDKWQLQEQD
jgi:hypothetical protein